MCALSLRVGLGLATLRETITLARGTAGQQLDDFTTSLTGDFCTNSASGFL